MPVFISQDGKLQTLPPLPCRYEKDLQRLIEDNLMEVLEMHYLATEYPTSGGRIDTLAVDTHGAPVIIEYKRERNGNVINQGLSYLKWLKAQKPEFFRMLMSERLEKSVFDGIKLDWNHPRVVCIAESFNRFDMDTAEVVPLRIELFRYRQYKADIFTLDLVTTAEQQDCPAFVPVHDDMNRIACDVMKAQSSASGLIQNLFDELRERILSIDEHITEKTNKKGAVYAVARHFAEIQIKKDRLVIDLRPIDYDDPQQKVERIGIGYTITMNRRIVLKEARDLDYVFSIIRQSYQNVL
jgi:predicted transport protein